MESAFNLARMIYPNRIAGSAQDAYTTSEIVYREPARKRISR